MCESFQEISITHWFSGVESLLSFLLIRLCTISTRFFFNWLQLLPCERLHVSTTVSLLTSLLAASSTSAASSRETLRLGFSSLPHKLLHVSSSLLLLQVSSP